jgi:hypothetical protein
VGIGYEKAGELQIEPIRFSVYETSNVCFSKLRPARSSDFETGQVKVWYY